MPTLEDVLTELAAAPPSAFTRARDTLLARLTKLGQVQVAARVKAVRRPTAPLWAVNRLAREEPESVERLIATADLDDRHETHQAVRLRPGAILWAVRGTPPGSMLYHLRSGPLVRVTRTRCVTGRTARWCP